MKSKLIWLAVCVTIICPAILGYYVWSERVQRDGNSHLSKGEFETQMGVALVWNPGGQRWGLQEAHFLAHDGEKVLSVTFVRTGSFGTWIYLRLYQVVLIAGAPLGLWGWVLVRSIVRRLRR